jgi:DNA-binding XRE family transcriptional regulator
MKPIPHKFVSDSNLLKGPKRKSPKNAAAAKIRETLICYEVSQKFLADELGIANCTLIDYMQGRRIPSIKLAVKIKNYFKENFCGIIIECDDWLKPNREED